MSAEVQVYDQILNSQPPLVKETGMDDRKTRYMFSPLHSHALNTLYVRYYGMPYFPAGVIVPIRLFSFKDQDFGIVGKLQVIDSSEAYGVTEDVDVPRTPGVNVRSMLRDWRETYGEPNGFREITTLAGVDDVAIGREMNKVFFAKRFDTAEAQIEHLRNFNRKGLDKRWTGTLDELLESYETAQRWCNRHYNRIVKALDAFSNNQPNGKAEVSEYDMRICAFIEKAVPRVASKLADATQQQVVKVEMVQPAAVSEGETGDCPRCWKPIPYREGIPAPYCFHCGLPTTPTEIPRTPSKSSIQLTDEPI